MEFFNKEFEILFSNLPSLDSEAQMIVLTETVNELIDFDVSKKEWIKDKVWEHYKMCVENTSYNMVEDDGFDDEVEANIAHFKIYNKDDAYEALQLNEICSDLDEPNYRYFNFIFKCPWDDEHGIWIGIKNGEFDSID